MDCRDFRRQYSAYRDGHDPALAAEMDDHMDICPTCASYDRAVREGVDSLRGGWVAPSDDFAERLQARIDSGEPVPEPIPPRVSTLAATVGAVLFMTLLGLTLKDLMVLPTPVAAESQPLVVAEPKLLAGMPFVTFQHVGSEPEVRP